ncbi:hypothetical protein OQA88_1046 [Cercophora sp. LCS_1]
MACEAYIVLVTFRTSAVADRPLSALSHTSRISPAATLKTPSIRRSLNDFFGYTRVHPASNRQTPSTTAPRTDKTPTTMPLLQPITSYLRPTDPRSRSESIMVEFLVDFINALILSSQLFNPSKFPAYASSSHQRLYTFGPGRESKQEPNGSFNMRVDGYMERPGPSPSVWIIHEVKQEGRASAGCFPPQVHVPP